jgi:putative phage-type endonuclease
LVALSFQSRIFTGEQGSQSWLDWRREGVGASDQAALNHCSKYATIPSLLLDKMGLGPVKDNAGMMWGRRREPEIRANVLKKYPKDAQPLCVVHPELTFMRASYDLISSDFTWACEIKTVNAKIYKALLDGTLPQDHWFQLHHQYSVTPELKELIYYAVHRKNGVDQVFCRPIVRDEKMIGICIENARNFMNELNEAKENYGAF